MSKHTSPPAPSVGVSSGSVFVAQITADGVTDDTAAWNTAITAAAAAGGGVVKPSKFGSCIVSGSGINLNVNNRVHVQGMGIKLLPAVSGTALTANPGVVGGSAVGAQFSGFEIDGGSRATTTAIKVRNANRVAFRDISYGNCTTGLLISNDGVGGYVEECHFENLYGYSNTTGLKLQVINGGSSSFEENTFVNVGLSGNTTGIDLSDSGVQMRDVHMYNVKVWATTPGTQTCLKIGCDCTDWTAFMQFESLPGAGLANIAIDVLSTATNIEIADLHLQFLDGAGYTWGTRIRLDVAQTLPLMYQNGPFRYEGGGTGGYPIRFRRDTDTADRLRMKLTGLEIGPGGSTTPDLTLTRQSDSTLDVNQDVSVNSVKLVKTNDARLGGGGGAPPSALGFAAMLCDPVQCASGSLPGGVGVVHGSMIYLPSATTPTQIEMICTVVPTGPTNYYLAVFDTSGTRLAVSADRSSVLGTTGEKLSSTLTVDTSITGLSGWVVCAMLLGAGSGSNWAKTAGSQSAVSAVAGRAHRGFTSGSGLTSMPSSITMGSVTDQASPIWFGLI